MFSSQNPQQGMIPLNEVAFSEDLPILLGCSKSHIKRLTRPSKGPSGEIFKRMDFPKPFMISSSGIRVWRIRDLEAWAMKINMKRTRRRMSYLGSTLVDRPEIVSRVIGRL